MRSSLACGLALAFFLLALFDNSPARAWGATGHRLIGELAILSLPEEVPAFLRSPEAAREIGELAREPDRWRGSGQEHDAERDPGHFVDVADDGTILGGPRLAALPSTRLEFDTQLRAIGSSQYKAGYLPYSIIDGWQQLKTDFAYWRVDAAGERLAKSEESRTWFVNDRLLREKLAVRDLGVWAHFVGDGSQPMHASVHYDGWGDYPNPEGFSVQHGVHLHFEGPFVRTNVNEMEVAGLALPPRDCGCTIEERTAQYLSLTNAQVAPFYRLEKAKAFESGVPEGKRFAATRVAAGAAELRDMIVMAWHASATAKIGYPPIDVGDAEAGKGEVLGSLKGED